MAISNTYVNSSIRKSLPSKVLTGDFVSAAGMESWLYDDGLGDPWWQGAAGMPYRWKLVANINASQHSNHLTRVPNQYTGLDIVPGMWVFADGEPKAVRIQSIISQTDTTIECIVEDIDRYNTFNDPSTYGVGIFASPSLVFFELGDDGLPKITQSANLTDWVSVSIVESRFRVFNPSLDLQMFQINHGFVEGQVVKLDSSTGKFANASSDDIYIVGTVVAVGPGPNYFYLSPSTKFITDLEPSLPGNIGDMIGIDPVTGDRTIVTGGNNALYLKMTKEVPTYSIGTIDDPVTFPGNEFKINNYKIVLDGDDAIDLPALIQKINATSTFHGVVASRGSIPTVVVGTAFEAMSTPATDLQFTVNNVVTRVATPSLMFGNAGQIGWWDIIRSVNEQTARHGVYATFDVYTEVITFTQSEGLDIKFTNISPTVTTGEDKTFTDMVGVPGITEAAPPTRLKLSRPDGGSIVVTDVMGSFLMDTGAQSSANGKIPIALIVDKTMSTNSMNMVSDLTALNAITSPRSGDQVYVQNGKTPGEWELYVRTGATWTLIADHDSAKTDASTMTVEVSKTSPASVSLGNMSNGTRIVNVTVVVSEAFSSAASLNVGTDDAIDVVLNDDIIDLSIVGSYESNTTYIYSGVADGELFVHLDSASSTSGKAKVIVSYL